MKAIVFVSLLCFVHPLFAQQTVGLFTKNPGSLDGYILFAPTRSDTTYLIDKCGKEIHKWASTYTPGLSVYLLPNGDLLRSGFYPNAYFSGPGGVIEIYDWNNVLKWSYVICNATETQNHDVYPMANGNILVVIWEKLSHAQAIAAGRNPAILGPSVWSAKIIEIQPVGTNSANIVWQWRLWDHLVQDFDNKKSNYGVVKDHPELLNLNFTNGNGAQVDWIHLNAVNYNAALDQIVISSHALSEIYVIDHSTTTAQAASHSGGLYGKGGDFLFRWGNPAAYDRGSILDQRLFSQHDSRWIPSGYPDGDKIMIFNNGVNRPGGNAASVDIISPPIDSAGNYSISPVLPFAPVNPDWSYMDPVPANFYSPIMAGAERLVNGNTLICEATKGNFFEIDSANNILWQYVNPVNNSGRITQGTAPMGNNSYRCVYYPANYSGFTSHLLTPGDPIEINPLPYVCNMTTAPLPVELITFTGKNVAEKNEFVWSTASERNNDYFTLERSRDAENYFPLKEIKGAGNSSIMIRYSYTDEVPLYGINYYRLKQTDFDGYYTYSNIITLNNTSPGKNNISVFQDPVHSTIKISAGIEINQIAILDITGKIISNHLPAGNYMEIDSGLFAKGIYLIRIISGNETILKKICVN